MFVARHGVANGKISPFKDGIVNAIAAFDSLPARFSHQLSAGRNHAQPVFRAQGEEWGWNYRMTGCKCEFPFSGNGGNDQNGFQKPEAVTDALATSSAKRKICKLGHVLFEFFGPAVRIEPKGLRKIAFSEMCQVLAHKTTRTGGRDVAIKRIIFQRSSPNYPEGRIQSQRSAAHGL